MQKRYMPARTKWRHGVGTMKLRFKEIVQRRTLTPREFWQAVAKIG